MPAPRPMLCKDAKGRAFPGEGWKQEPKLDGWRFLFHVRSCGNVRAWAARNGNERTGQAEVIEAVIATLPPDTILDCELIVPGEKSPRVAHELAHGGANLEAYFFDVLRAGGEDTTRRPYWERRELLAKLAELFVDPCYLMPSMPADKRRHDAWVKDGLEGSVCKRADSLYVAGKTWDWAKYKPQESDEAIILGFEPGTGKWRGLAGAFQIRMIGTDVITTCSTGTDVVRQEIQTTPEKYLGKIIEVAHHGLMDSGKPRHPQFVRLRDDLEGSEVAMAEELPATKANPFEAEIGKSPIRSSTGRIRNVKQMSDDKLRGLVFEMRGYDEADPEGYATVMAEAARRELVIA